METKGRKTGGAAVFAGCLGPRLVSGTVLLALVVVGMTGAAPNVQDENDLVLDKLEFKWEKPKTIVIYPGSPEGAEKGEAVTSGRIYWYMPYTLTNKGKQAASFFVTVRARSDKDKTYSDLALAHVEKRIEHVEQRKLLSKVDLLADAKRDEHRYVEFAPGDSKQCVAIFNPLDAEADTITVDVHGLLNDLKIENLGEGRFRIEERVLRLTFSRPGDEIFPTFDKIAFRSKKWVTITQTTPVANK